MEELFSLPIVLNKPPPETGNNTGSEPVEGTVFQDALDEKIQEDSANEQDQADDVSLDAEAAASQVQQQIITVTNKAFDELITPGGEVETSEVSPLQDTLSALSDETPQFAAFDVEDLAVVSEDIDLEDLLHNDEIQKTVKFSAEMTKDITALELETGPGEAGPMDISGGQVIQIEQIQIQTELQNAEIAQEDTSQIDLDINTDDLDALEIGAKDLKGMKEMDELIESDRMAETLLPRIINRIIDGVKAKTDKGTTSLRIQLHPSELGKIGVRLTMREDGIHISLAADSNTTQKLLQDNASALKQALESAGINLSSFDMGNEGFQQHAEGKTSKNGNPQIHLINEPITPVQFPSNSISANPSSGLDYRI